MPFLKKKKKKKSFSKQSSAFFFHQNRMLGKENSCAFSCYDHTQTSMSVPRQCLDQKATARSFLD